MSTLRFYSSKVPLQEGLLQRFLCEMLFLLEKMGEKDRINNDFSGRSQQRLKFV